MKTWKIIALAAGLPIVMIICVVVAFRLAVPFVANAIIPSAATNPTQYSSKHQQWSSTGLIGHFPTSVPSNATNVRFSEFPGFLQGGAHLQLNVELPAIDVQLIVKQISQSAIVTFTGGGDTNDHANISGGVPTTFYYTSASPGTLEFPPDFTLYVLHAQDRGGHWNHGESCGIAINPVTNEVVYWAEQW